MTIFIANLLFQKVAELVPKRYKKQRTDSSTKTPNATHTYALNPVSNRPRRYFAVILSKSKFSLSLPPLIVGMGVREDQLPIFQVFTKHFSILRPPPNLRK